ncbi:hypothetical protein Tco_0755600 [Tanacetum coccineum]
MIVDIEDDIMDPVMQCTTLPSHSGFSQKKLVSFVTEIHTSYALSWKPCQGDSLNLPDHSFWDNTVDGFEQTYPPTIAKEKLARKNKLKARAIEKRFGGNKESKKTQKTLLNQQYENFNGSSSEGLDQTYDRLQNLISQLEILGETISQEDMNLKAPRENRNIEPVRRNVTVETTETKALVDHVGIGYEWSDQAKKD